MFIFNLVGGQFRPTSCQVEAICLQPHTMLELRRDPHNPHDPNAIQIHSVRTGAHLGFVPRHIAAEIAPKMDEEREDWVAFVKSNRGLRKIELYASARSDPEWLKLSVENNEQVKLNIDDNIPF